MPPPKIIKRPKTRELILDVSLGLFNVHGYGSTPKARIAEESDIAVGNLWYHFPTKESLLSALCERFKNRLSTSFDASHVPGTVLDNYVALIYGWIRDVWEFRFIWRDRLQFDGFDPVDAFGDVPDAHATRLVALLNRMAREGLFRNPIPDIDALQTNLWLVCRYWGEHLQEREGKLELTWQDIERGFHQNLAILRPHLRPSADRQLNDAVSNVLNDKHA